MREKLLVVLIGVLLLSSGWVPQVGVPNELQHIEVGSPVTPRIDRRVSAASAGLGPSIPITYEILDRCVWYDYEVTQLPSADGWSYYSATTPYLADDDGDYFVWGVYDTDTQVWTARLRFRIHSPYNQLASVDYSLMYTESGGAFESDVLYLYLYSTTDRATITFPDSDGAEDAGTTALGPGYVVDGYICGEFLLSCQDNEAAVDLVVISIDHLEFNFDTLTETRRSSYTVQGGTVRYACDWTTWDYNVNATLSVPSAWTFQDVNPDCDQTSDEFACLVPEDYEAIYTADVLATANWQEHFSDSFESGWQQWIQYAMGGTVELDYTYVLDGAASLHTTETGGGAVIQLAYFLADGEYDVVYNLYIVTGTPRIYYYDGSWHYTELSTTGAWLSGVYHLSISGYVASPNRNFILYLTTADECYWDAITFYNSSVSTGQTITGTCRHMHPNGYTAAAFVDVELGLWDAAYNWKEYADVTTDASGAWSFDTDEFSTSFTAQSYHLWTWVYADANAEWALDAITESTTDWTSTWSTFTTDTDSYEGVYSLEGEGAIPAVGGFRQDVYNPAAAWDGSGLYSYYVKINATSQFNLMYPYVRDTSGHYKYTYSTSGKFPTLTDDTWSQFVIPMRDPYWQNYDAGFDASTMDNCRTMTMRVGTTGGACHHRADSVNFIHYYTSDALSYPFSLPSDWELTGAFDEGDVKVFYNYLTNYDGSYEVFENDSSVASGSITAMSGSFSWTKHTSIGLYEVGVEFTITDYTGSIWKNWSYTISAGQTWLHIVFLEYDGDLIPWNTFIVYIDDEIAGSSVINVNASSTVNVTVVDDFGELLYQNATFPTTSDTNTYLRETLNVFTMNLNNRHELPCYAIIERNGASWTSPAMGWMGSVAYRVYGSLSGITYTVSWYRDHDDHLEETHTWTVYQQDLNVYNGYQKPDVDAPLPYITTLIDLPDFLTVMGWIALVVVVLVLIGLLLRTPTPHAPTVEGLVPPQAPRPPDQPVTLGDERRRDADARRANAAAIRQERERRRKAHQNARQRR